MSKVVVEDQGGRIQYSEGWEKNAVCVACDITVDKVLQAASAGTWMQTWWASGRTQVSATLDFEGTGVDAYFLFFWRSQDPNSTGDSSLLFFVDDKLELTRPIVASDYQFTGDIAPRSLVFSKSGYSAGKHTLRLHWTNSGPRPRVAVALDKIEYTPNPTVRPPTVSTTTTSTSTTAAPGTSSPATSSSNTAGSSGKTSGTTIQTGSDSLSTTSSASDSLGTSLSGAAGPPDGGSGGSGSSSSGGSSQNNDGTAAGSGSDQADQTGAASNNTAKIVGPVVAVVVLLALLVGGLLIWRRRRRRARVAEYVDNADPFAPTAHGPPQFNHAVAHNAPTMYMAASPFTQTPVSQASQPGGAAQHPQQYGHQRTLSPDSNSQYSWNAASAYTGISGGSGGSNPFVGSSVGATNAAAVAPSTVYSPPPYSVGPEQVVAARGSEKRRVVP